MEAHVTFANVPINYITDSFSVSKTQNHRTSPYIGDKGSNTSYVSSTGKIISFKSMCLNDETGTGDIPRIQEYIALSETYNQKESTLTSPSYANLNGNYILTDFKYSEDTSGNFTIDWEFTEQIPFNVTQKTFRVWNKSKINTSTKTTKKSLDSNTKKLLNDCPTLSKGSTKTKCVKYLQLFLQSQGYYAKNKVDGKYEDKTVSAVKKLQQKYTKNILNGKLLKTNGKWDENTRTYFQIYFEYPKLVSTIEKSLIKTPKKTVIQKTISKKKK